MLYRWNFPKPAPHLAFSPIISSKLLPHLASSLVLTRNPISIATLGHQRATTVATTGFQPRASPLLQYKYIISLQALQLLQHRHIKPSKLLQLLQHSHIKPSRHLQLLQHRHQASLQHSNHKAFHDLFVLFCS